MKTRFSGVMVLVFIGFITSAAQAQNGPIDKKSFTLGGSISILSKSGDLYGDEVQTTISFEPGFAYFIMRGLAVGADLMYQRESSGNSSSTIVGIMPKVAYFFDAGNKFYPYLGAAFGYAAETSSWSGPYSSSSTSTGFLFLGAGGVAYMLKPNLAIFVELNYQILSMTPEHGDTESGGTLAFRIGLTAFIY